VVGPASAVSGNIPSFDGTTGKLIQDGGYSFADLLDRANHTGAQTLSTISDAGSAAALDVPASGDAASVEVVKGNDSRLTDARTPTSHTHTLSDVTDAGTSAGLDVPSSGNSADGEVVKGSDTRLKEGAITVTIGDGENAITAGAKAILAEMPYAGTITGWTLVADQSGSIVLDVWKDTYANIPPTVADTIAGTEKPTLSSAHKNQDLSLSTWTTSLSKGDSLIFNVDSASTVTRVSLVLRITKS
jgi:hypothetical protein